MGPSVFGFTTAEQIQESLEATSLVNVVREV